MNKKIRSPQFLNYPVTIIETYASEGMPVEVEQNLFVVMDQGGAKFSIKSKVAGKIETVYFAFGMDLTAPSILCEISVPVQAQSSGASQERDVAEASEAKTKGNAEKQSVGNKRGKFRHRTNTPKAPRPSLAPIAVVLGYWFISMVLLFFILFPITANGAVFWEHIIFPIGLGVIPLLTISGLMRRLTDRVSGSKTPRIVALVFMILSYYPLAYVTSEPDGAKAEYAEQAYSYLADLGQFPFVLSLGLWKLDKLESHEEEALREQIEVQMEFITGTDGRGKPREPRQIPLTIVYKGTLNDAILAECVEKGLISNGTARPLRRKWRASIQIAREYVDDISFQGMVDAGEIQFETVYKDNQISLRKTCSEVVQIIPVRTIARSEKS